MGDLAKKSNNCLANIEQQLMAKIAKKQQWPTGPMPPSTQPVDQQQARN